MKTQRRWAGLVHLRTKWWVELRLCCEPEPQGDRLSAPCGRGLCSWHSVTAAVRMCSRDVGVLAEWGTWCASLSLQLLGQTSLARCPLTGLVERLALSAPRPFPQTENSAHLTLVRILSPKVNVFQTNNFGKSIPKSFQDLDGISLRAGLFLPALLLAFVYTRSALPSLQVWAEERRVRGRGRQARGCCRDCRCLGGGGARSCL